MIQCKHITIVVTNECNMHCKGCYVGQKKEHFNVQLFQEKILPEFLEIGGRSIGFSGGEPLLFENIKECIKMSREAGLETSLVTNGFLFTEETALELKRAGLQRVQISLDAGNQKINDILRQEGAFETVVSQAVPNAIKAGLRTTLVAVPNSYLMKHVKEYLDLAEVLDVDAVYFRRCVDSSEKIPCEEELEEYLVFLETLEEIKSNYKMEIYSGDPMQSAIRLEKIETKHWKKMFSGCSAGITSLAICPNGNVYPCTRLPVTLGNAYQENLQDIWKQSPILYDLRVRNLEGHCGACAYKYVCGGCRAEAYYKFQNYLGEDPMCYMKRGK